MNSNPRAHGAPPWFTPKKTDVEPRTRTHGDLPRLKTIPQAMGEQTLQAMGEQTLQAMGEQTPQARG